MRITVDIDDDTLLLVKKYMKAWRMPLGNALSGLVRQGLNSSVPTRRVNGLLIFDSEERVSASDNEESP
jgi:hypothetical protein